MKAISRLKSFLEKCVRVWKITRKPGRKEFITIAKVSALGVLIIGLLGFTVSIIVNIFF